jgi:hypothetical protein
MNSFATTIPTAHITTSPTNGSAYKASDFLRDTIVKIRAAGGDPNMVLASPDWMVGLAIWGYNVENIVTKTTTLGLAVTSLLVPFLDRPVQFVEHGQLAAGSAVVLSADEVSIRYLQNESFEERGRRGDAYEGDWISDMAIDPGDASHHAWLEGVTGFAKTA